MAYGTGEWRQLLLDMQEIVDWLARAGQELMSQQPIASDIEMVQEQNKHHQVSETKLEFEISERGSFSSCSYSVMILI